MSYCQICNKEFITKRKTDKFCHNMHFKFCVVCGKKYEVKCDKFFAKRLCCSKECKKRLVGMRSVEYWQNGDYRNRVIQGNSKSWNAERKAKHSEFAKKMWQSQEHRDRMREVSKNNMQKITKKLWSDENYKIRKSAENAKRYAEATLKGESAKIYVIDYDDFIKIGIRQSDRRFSTLRPKYTKRGKLLFEFELPTQKAIDLDYQIAITKSKEHIQGKGKTECYKKESLQDFLKMLQVAKSK